MQLKRSRFLFAILPVLFCLFAFADTLNEQLLAAARQGDMESVKKLLDQGADINAKSPYSATALLFAIDRDNLELVKLLADRGADVNIKDTFYGSDPIGWAVYKGNVEIVRVLQDHGATGREDALMTAIQMEKMDVTKAILEKPGLKGETLSEALRWANDNNQKELAELLRKAGATLTPVVDIAPEILKSYAGSYKSAEGNELRIQLKEESLFAQMTGQEPFPLIAMDATTFKPAAFSGFTISFQKNSSGVTGFTVNRDDGSASQYSRIQESAAQAEAPPPAVSAGAATVAPAVASPVQSKEPANWPSFRGPNASGVADGLNVPVKWDGPKNSNILWKMPIAGLANSSPVVWENKAFVISAISSDAKAALKHGLYGDVEPDKDISRHQWVVYCIDKITGKLLWWKTINEGPPRVKRHPKSTQANSTPVTDGKHLIVLTGNGDLVCYDLNGKVKWKNDLGTLNAGWFFDPDYEWGFGSSPIIYKDLVIIQVDIQKNSYIAAFKVKNGKQEWMTPRDEIPSWGTPTIVTTTVRDELVTNGTKFIRGYDPLTGKELWRLSGNSEITVPTPITSKGLIYVTSGYRPVQPIYAIRAGATGDITLPKDVETNQWILWSKNRGGPYMPTPIVYGDYLYTLANNGVLTCYDSMKGEKLYQERLGGKGSAYAFTASPVASDGKLYLSSEDGEIFVVKAGPKFEVISVNSMGEVIMATPAITNNTFIVRTLNNIYAIGNK